MTDAETSLWDAFEAFEANPTPETWRAAKTAAEAMPDAFFATPRYIDWVLRISEPHLSAMEMLP